MAAKVGSGRNRQQCRQNARSSLLMELKIVDVGLPDGQK
jgi:hypothetical protein